jgi:hypothetical protein
MKLFRLNRKSESGEEEKELILDTDAEGQAPAQEMTEAEAKAGASLDAPTAAAAAEAAAQTEAPAPAGDLLAQISAEATSEIEAAEKTPENDPGSPQGDDSLDPDLLALFREAKNEIVETTLASELPDIPMQDLLSDLENVSQRLGITPRARADPSHDKAQDPRAGRSED